MKSLTFLIIFVAIITSSLAAAPRFAPYYDTTLLVPNLEDVYAKTGQLDYTLAFALGSNEGCVPKWGGAIEIDDPLILGPIKKMISLGGQMIVATGGAGGPYLEHMCGTSEALLGAYKIILDTVGTNHLDIDIEAIVNFDVMNQALFLLQSERPDVSVSFTLMVQGEDYGITLALGVDLLVNAKKNGVRVDVCNIMTMEYPKLTTTPTWGESIINAANSTLYQLKEIWPEKTEEELKKMIGITPMLGRNFNSNIFSVEDANYVINSARGIGYGFVSFWSIGRDNGGCPGAESLSPYCSGIQQDEFEFTQKFREF